MCPSGSALCPSGSDLWRADAAVFCNEPAMRCDAMQCDAMRYDAMRCDAMQCDPTVMDRLQQCAPTRALHQPLPIAQQRRHYSDKRQENRCSRAYGCFPVSTTECAILEHSVPNEPARAVTGRMWHWPALNRNTARTASRSASRPHGAVILCVVQHRKDFVHFGRELRQRRRQRRHKVSVPNRPKQTNKPLQRLQLCSVRYSVGRNLRQYCRSGTRYE